MFSEKADGLNQGQLTTKHRKVPEEIGERDSVWDTLHLTISPAKDYLIEISDNSMAPKFLRGDLLRMKFATQSSGTLERFHDRFCEVWTRKGPLLRLVDVKADPTIEGVYRLLLKPLNPRFHSRILVGPGTELFGEFLEIQQRTASPD